MAKMMQPSSASVVATAMALCLSVVMVANVRGDIASDRAECMDQLLSLMPCVSYVATGSVVKVPTPDCCTAVNSVASKSPRCLCVLIKDRNDSAISSLNIDPQRALGLPGICSGTYEDARRCLDLLNLAPGSPDAQIFEQYGSQGNTTTTNPKTGNQMAPALSPPLMSNDGARSRYYGGGSRRWWLGVDVLCVVWVYHCFANVLLNF